MLGRRAFVQRAALAALALAVGPDRRPGLRPRSDAGARRPGSHPDPRPGVTADRVLRPDQFGRKRRDALKAYEAAREIPHVLDGLHCYCDCGPSMGHRSLLSCFEDDQGAGCAPCQEQALLALRLYRRGRPLREIRAALDDDFA